MTRKLRKQKIKHNNDIQTFCFSGAIGQYYLETNEGVPYGRSMHDQMQ